MVEVERSTEDYTQKMERASADLFGIANSAAAYDLRDFLKRSGVSFKWTELHSDREAQQLLGFTGLEDLRLPACKLSQGSILYNPSIHDLACALDWFRSPKLPKYDVVIYGAGPAGLSAAVYAASEGLSTLVIERSAVGGQAASSSRIENYLGFPDGISGWELASRARQQAQRLGAEIIVSDEGVESEEDILGVTWLASGTRIVSRATICATGVDYTRLNLPDEDKYLNHGVFYGAGASEAARCRGEVFVIGGGNSAGQAALNFAEHAHKVTMLIRGSSLRDTLSEYLVERIYQSGRIDVCTHSVVTRLHGLEALEGITYLSTLTGEAKTVQTGWLFICIGGAPRTTWADPKSVRTDRAGYILTGPDISIESLPSRYWSGGHRPLFMETSRPGMFAAGDVRHNSVKRCATAVGDGATAVSMVHQYLALERSH